MIESAEAWDDAHPLRSDILSRPPSAGRSSEHEFPGYQRVGFDKEAMTRVDKIVRDRHRARI